MSTNCSTYTHNHLQQTTAIRAANLTCSWHLTTGHRMDGRRGRPHYFLPLIWCQDEEKSESPVSPVCITQKNQIAIPVFLVSCHDQVGYQVTSWKSSFENIKNVVASKRKSEILVPNDSRLLNPK